MKKQTKKVCFVIPHLCGGGAERVVTVLAGAVAEMGIETILIKYHPMENEYPISDNVKVRTLVSSEGIYKSLNYGSKVKKLRQILKEESPLYVVPFLPQSARHIFLAKIGTGIRQVDTVRIAPWLAQSNRLMRLARDAIIALSYRTFVQTQEQKEYFPKFVQKKIFVLPNPVSNIMINTLWNQEKRITRILTVGRLSEQKNFKLAIDVTKMLREMGYPVTLDIFGEGELRETLQQYINDISAGEYCFLRGRSSNMAEEYRNHHVYFLSSNFEGMPNTLMEAMAVGMPCVATNCPTGPAELIGNDRGILVPVLERSKAVKALKKLIDNPDFALEIGMKAKQYIQNQYSDSIIAKRFIENTVYLGEKQ